MDPKRKFLIAGMMLVAASSFLLDQFWSCTLCGLQRAIAVDIVPMLFFSKFFAGIAGIHFLL